MKIKNKTIKSFKGKVYDLCIEGSHTYNVEGVAVHNSGAGSLVNYALGITQVDPIKHGLLFARMLTKKKAGNADIDSDCSNREEAIKILTEHFGAECVLPVSVFNQLQLKSLMKDLAKLYGIPFEVINPLTSKIEDETLKIDKQQPGFDRGVWFLTYESAFENSPTFKQLLLDHPQLDSSLRVLFKQIKSCFDENTVILTNKGWKKYKDIVEKVDGVGYINHIGELDFNKNYVKILSGYKQLFRVVLDNGEEILLTEDHKVCTVKGWKEVKDLSQEDEIVEWR